jgi:hypothetical protein
MNPVIVEGIAELVREPEALATLLALENAKYNTNYTIELLDPEINSAFRVRPRWAFGLRQDDFTGSPTRWNFEP